MDTVYTDLQTQCNPSDMSGINKSQTEMHSLPHQLHSEKLYILYGYNTYNSLYPTKYIYGTYYNITDAENRINKLCAKSGFKREFNKYYSNDGRMTYFINMIPIGDQCTELFTT
jgi:hypothetical protein